MKLNVFTAFEKASEVLSDPLILSMILLKTSPKSVFVVRDRLNSALNRILLISKNVTRENNTLFIKISSEDTSWSFRAIVCNKLIVALIYENRERNFLGWKALEVLQNKIDENPMVSVLVCVLTIDSLPEALKEYVLKALHESLIRPPETWYGRTLSGVRIDKVLSKASLVFYTLLGEVGGSKYVVKIPRENYVLGKNYNEIIMAFRGYMDLMILHSLSEKDIVSRLSKAYNIDEGIAAMLLLYKQNLPIVTGIVIPKHLYTLEEDYIEAPPMCMIEYGDLGSLQDLAFEVQNLDLKQLLCITIKILGALALMHGLGMVHGAIKPSNIIFRKRGFEDPMLTDPAPYVNNIRPLLSIYTDPIAIVTNRIDMMNDVYSLGLVIIEMISGTRLIGRHLINAYLLSIHGLNDFAASILKERPSIEHYFRKLDVFKDRIEDMQKRSAKLSELTSLLDSMYKVVAELDKDAFNKISEHKCISGVLLRAISLNPAERYSSAFEFWFDMLRCIEDLGLQDILPKRS